MSDRKIYPHFFKHAILLFALIHTAAYSVSVDVPKDVSSYDKGPIEKFLEKNCYIQPMDYDGGAGTVGLFSVGDKQNFWYELSGVGKEYFFGHSLGYRYLQKSIFPSEERFIGVYESIGISIDNARYFVDCNVGGEISTSNFQLTVNYHEAFFAESFLALRKANVERLLPARNATARLSVYEPFCTKKRYLGLVNLFGLAEADELKNINLGLGFRGEGTYLSWEFKLIKDPMCSSPVLRRVGPVRLDFGIHIHFTEQDANIRGKPRSRLLQLPQRYFKPHYYRQIAKVPTV